MAKNEPVFRNAASGCNVALVGASTLKGKEVKEILQQRRFPLSHLALLDAEDAGGQLTEFDNEPAVIHLIEKESFRDVAIVIFASSMAVTEKHWQAAESSGCKIIDLSYALESNPRAILRAPVMESLWASGEQPSAAQISVSAYPAAMAIAGVLSQLSLHFTVERSVATVYESVSEHGQAGVDELHRQTVNLLSFQKIPQAVFNSQVAFNMFAISPENPQPTLREMQDRIYNHLGSLLGRRVERPALQVLQAPLFHGEAFSCYCELSDRVSQAAVEEALDRKPFEIWSDPESQPNVVAAAGSDTILIGSVVKDRAHEAGYWIWGALDNLRLTAINAVEIAEELTSAGVQRE